MSILENYEIYARLLQRTPLELCHQLIFATNTKPYHMEVYYKVFQNKQGERKPCILLRFYGKNSKANGRPAVYDFRLYLRAAKKLIRLMETIAYGSVFELYLKTWLAREWRRGNVKLSCFSEGSNMENAAAIRERCRADYYEKVINGKADGIFLREINIDETVFGDQYPVRDKRLTLDYTPIRTFRKENDVWMKPWVFRLTTYRVRNKNCDFSAGEEPEVVPAETLEIRLSAVKMCELAMAIYDAVYTHGEQVLAMEKAQPAG